MLVKKDYSKLGWLFLIIVLCLFVVVIIVVGALYKESNDKSIPRMDIVLKNVSLGEVNGNNKEIIYKDNTVTLSSYGKEDVFNSVELKGRGNYSWVVEKKSYNLRFPGKISLLRMGRHRKWGLIANYLDDTALRNDVGHYISNLMTNHPILGDYLELTIDGQDLGLYYLSELASIRKDFIDMKDPLGVLVEFDKVYCKDEEYYYESETLKDCMSLKDVVDDNNSKIAMDNFMDGYNEFEKMLIEGYYDDIFNLIDKESWAEYFLLSEFTGNIDAYTTSWLFYKNGTEDKIHSGPGWDFDAGFGNRNWGDWPGGFYDPNTIMARVKFSFSERGDYIEGKKMGCRYETEGNEMSLNYVSPIMCYMIDIPEFNDEVSRLYKERLMDKRDETLNYIRNRASYIREAAIRNNEMWGKGDFDEAVDYLVWWVDKRFDLFDRLYGGVKTEFLEEPSEL